MPSASLALGLLLATAAPVLSAGSADAPSPAAAQFEAELTALVQAELMPPAKVGRLMNEFTTRQHQAQEDPGRFSTKDWEKSQQAVGQIVAFSAKFEQAKLQKDSPEGLTATRYSDLRTSLDGILATLAIEDPALEERYLAQLRPPADKLRAMETRSDADRGTIAARRDEMRSGELGAVASADARGAQAALNSYFDRNRAGSPGSEPVAAPSAGRTPGPSGQAAPMTGRTGYNTIRTPEVPFPKDAAPERGPGLLQKASSWFKSRVDHATNGALDKLDSKMDFTDQERQAARTGATVGAVIGEGFGVAASSIGCLWTTLAYPACVAAGRRRNDDRPGADRRRPGRDDGRAGRAVRPEGGGRIGLSPPIS